MMSSCDTSFLLYRYIYTFFSSLYCNISFCDASTIDRLNDQNFCPHYVILPCYESVILQNNILSMRPNGLKLADKSLQLKDRI